MSATREAVLREARSWLGTPFHHCADVKGAGVDCAMLLVRVYCDLGIAPAFDPRPYKPQWFLHSSEPRYLKWLMKYARRIEAPEPGDVLLFSFGKHAAHGAILLEDGRSILHAMVPPIGRVIVDDRQRFGQEFHSAWSPFPAEIAP